ncbi:MAG: hypothetical protein Q8Q82_15380 [Hydrogenophaga sp.]|nr:hypothetical protein [Hydrogenophaga sp.]
MSIPARARCLMLVMLWQAMAWLTPVPLQLQADAIAHLVVHTQDVDHHHHDDDSLHLEADASTPPHHHASDGVQPSGLEPVTATAPVHLPPTVPAVRLEQDRPSADLEGLLRPPRARA